VDAQGKCCSGVVDAVTGKCCGAADRQDSQGLCCTSPAKVDACGLCGGTGIVVDARGVCCPVALPPSGLCCKPPATVDSCGVCGGVNACAAQVTISMALAMNSTTGLPVAPSTAAAHALALAAGVPSTLLSTVAFAPTQAATDSSTSTGFSVRDTFTY
jgi:hypothetical protein